MSNLNILIPDNLHINNKNFPSFFKFLDKDKIKVKFIDSRNDWISLYGDYESKLNILSEKIRMLHHIPPHVLLSYSVKEVRLFKVSRAEILSKVITESVWYKQPIPSTEEEIFNKLLSCNKLILLQCLAAAWDWIEFWDKTIQDEKQFSHACIFSGSLIYQRSLIELLRYKPTKVFVMESFFTGNDYYCEEKYEPIANNSDIKFTAVYKSTLSELDENNKTREIKKAINKFLLSKNKNVTQPEDGEDIVFEMQGKIITIIGQVINDFSVLEYKNIGISTICFYKALIKECISNEINIVFKTHPWEEKKLNIKKAFTKEQIEMLYEELSDKEKKRLKIVDHFPITKLFAISDFIVGLNSQGLIEAAFEGLKPVQFADAFYGKKGFTHDYSLNEIDLFIEDILNNKISGIMTLPEFKEFQLFLMKMLQGQLISIHDSGMTKLASIFAPYPHIKLLSKKNSVHNAESKPSPANSRNTNVSTIPAQKQQLGKLEGVRHDSPNKMANKYLKFRKTPRRFFLDSKYKAVQLFHIFFRK